MSCNDARIRLVALCTAVIAIIAAMLTGSAGPASATAGAARAAGAVGAVGAAGTVGTGKAAKSVPTGPAGNAFYVPPSPLPPGRPGDLIRYRKMPDVLGADSYLVLYLSRSALDQPIAVSGTVIVPKRGDRASMPVVGVGVGTVGLADGCAASKSPLTIAAQALGALNQGWALAATDYEGLGTPGLHTYQVGRSEGHAVLDAVRAAQRLPAAGLSPSSKVGLWGYSQGGGAVGWAGELQPTYAPELNLKGIAAGGVPADLLATAGQHGDETFGFGLLPMTALGMDAAYPDIRLDTFLTPLGEKLLGAISQLCLVPTLALMLGRSIGELTTRNPLADATFLRRVNENKLGSHPPRVPIFLFHGNLDEGVPYGQAKALMKTYCAAGANVTWRTYLGEHITTGAAGLPAARKFLTSRFGEVPVTGTC